MNDTERASAQKIESACSLLDGPGQVTLKLVEVAGGQYTLELQPPRVVLTQSDVDAPKESLARQIAEQLSARM